MAERVLNIGMTALVISLVARYLGPEQFGILSYATSIVSIFATAGHVGLAGLVVRELVKYPEVENETLGTTFMLKGIGYFIGLIFLLIFTILTESSGNIEFWILVTLSLGLLFEPLNIIDFWFQSRVESKFTSISKTTSLLMGSVLKLICIIAGAKALQFAIVNVLQSLTLAAFLLYFYQKKSKNNIQHWCVSKLRAKALFQQSWVIFLGTIFSMIYLKIDQVMLKWIVGSKEVGIYSVAANLSEVWYFVPVAIVSSLFPQLIKLKEEKPSIYLIKLQQIFDLLFFIALIIAILVTLFAKPIVALMFGLAYEKSAAILVVHVWTALFIFMRTLFSRWILIENTLVFSLITQSSGAFMNVLLNLILIPKYGGIGAAYATLISYAVASYFALMFYDKTRPVFWMMTKSFFVPFRYWAVLGKRKES